MRKVLFAAALLLMSTASQASSTQDRIDAGTNRGVIGVRIAVPEFQAANADPKLAQLVAVFNKVLWDDLEYSGVLMLVSRSLYPLGRFGNAVEIKVDDWIGTNVNAQFLAFGNARLNGPRISFDARLWDLKNTQNREVRDASNRYGTEATEEGARLLAHTFADAIVDAIGGGVRGIARTQIAYVAERGPDAHEIFIMDYDGHNQHALTNFKSTMRNPAWSPDGEKIAFSSTRRGGREIEILAVEDRRPHSFERAGGTTSMPAWSPDGSKIAFASSRDGSSMQIYVADWNGRNMRRLTVSKSIDVSPVWNPRTGRDIAFVSNRSGSPQIYVMDAEGTNVRRIIEGGGEAVSPAWSPDGQRIAFAWQRARTGYFDIYIHELATGNNIQLTQNAGDNEKPTWAPDGRHIAFESSRNGSRHIFSMLADGRDVRQLTTTGKNTGPAWSGYFKQ